MPRRELFTEAEFKQISARAVEVTWQKCSASPDELRSLIESGLGIRGVAAGSVMEQAELDAGYLHTLVGDYVQGLDEQGVLDLLARHGDALAAAQQLGFDPFDAGRAQAYRRSRQTVNLHQGLALMAGIFAFLLMAIFPPWVEVKRERTSTFILFAGSRDLSRTFIGYDYAFAKKSPKVVSSQRKPQEYKRISVSLEYDWDLRTLMLQSCALFGAVTVAVILLRSMPYRPEVFAQNQAQKSAQGRPQKPATPGLDRLQRKDSKE